MRWDDLHRLCVMYFHDPERTKNLVTELKFVDIDYSVFMSIKREPVDEEVTGIERGYEHFLDTEFYSDEALSEDSASQESRPYSLGSDGAGESPNCFLPVPQKSDPDVLRSLRMFRPNLKRARPVQVEEKVPEKVFIRSSNTVSPIVPIPTSPSKSLSHENDPRYPYAYTNNYLNNYAEECKLSNYERNFMHAYSTNAKLGESKLLKVTNTYSKACKNKPVYQPEVINLAMDSDDSKDSSAASKNEKVATLPPQASGAQVAENNSLLSELLKETPCKKTPESPSAERMVVLFEDFEKFSGQMINSEKVVIPKPITPERPSPYQKKIRFDEDFKSKSESSLDAQIKDVKVMLNRVNVKSYINRKLKRRVEEEERRMGKQCENRNAVQYPTIEKPTQRSLLDMNPRVVLNRDDIISVPDLAKFRNKVPTSKEEKFNGGSKVGYPKVEYPKVFLERLELNRKRDVKSVLANVPGLHDLQLIRPSAVNHIVQVKLSYKWLCLSYKWL